MLLGTQVKNCRVAVGRLQKVYLIVKIDGNDVNADNIIPYLLGSDIPGSQVIIAVLRTKDGTMRKIGSEYCRNHKNIADVM